MILIKSLKIILFYLLYFQIFYSISIACQKTFAQQEPYGLQCDCVCVMYSRTSVFEIIGGIDLIRNSSADPHLIALTKSGSCLVTFNEAVDGSVTCGTSWYHNRD